MGEFQGMGRTPHKSLFQRAGPPTLGAGQPSNVKAARSSVERCLGIAWVLLLGLLAGTACERRLASSFLPPGKPFTNSMGMEFVFIPPAAFVMGSPENEKGRHDDEAPHAVTLTKGFYCQTTEVTQGQWLEVMGDNPSHFHGCGEDCPVEFVSWNDCQEFIRLLNRREGGRKYRLPTEAEWEYACRAGSQEAFASGSITETGCSHAPNLDAIGWYCGNAGRRPHPVAQKSPNRFGLYDMHGNMWEWCQDWYGPYPSCPVTDPTGPPSGSGRVLRGGGWHEDAADCRSAVRVGRAADGKAGTLGFRLVRMP